MNTFLGYRPRPPEDYRAKGTANAPDAVQYEGVRFSDGTVVVRWLTDYRSHSVWASWSDFWHVHGHPEYGTRIEWQGREGGTGCATCGLPVRGHVSTDGHTWRSLFLEELAEEWINRHLDDTQQRIHEAVLADYRKGVITKEQLIADLLADGVPRAAEHGLLHVQRRGESEFRNLVCWCGWAAEISHGVNPHEVIKMHAADPESSAAELATDMKEHLPAGTTFRRNVEALHGS